MRMLAHRLWIIVLALCVSGEVWSQASPLAGWPQTFVPGDEPAVRVADLDGDGDPELVVPTAVGIRVYEADGTLAAGWPSPNSQLATNHVVVGNIAGDDKLEIIHFQGTGIGFQAHHHDGTIVAGWPFSVVPALNVGLVTSHHKYFALGDVDADGYDEFVFLADPIREEAYAIDGDGTVVPGWPVTLPFPPGSQYGFRLLSGLAVADLDLDTRDEVIITHVAINGPSVLSSPIWVFDGDGTPRQTIFPHPGGGIETPIVADIDGDFIPELISHSPSRLYAHHVDGTVVFDSMAMPHPVLRFGGVGDLEGDGKTEILLSGPELQLVKYTDSGIPQNFYVAASTPTTDAAQLYWAPVTGDVDGDGDLEIVVWSESPTFQMHVFDSSLQELPGWPKNHSPQSNPANIISATLADLDNDQDVEIIYTYNGQLYVWNQTPTGTQGRGAAWGQLGHDASGGSDMARGNEPVASFMRGDGNRSGAAEVSDVVFILRYLFLGQESTCLPALDVDNDGAVAPMDAIALLGTLFLGQAVPEAPFPNCEAHGADFALPCFEFSCP